MTVADEKKLNKKLNEVLQLVKGRQALAVYRPVGKYYVSFEYRLMLKKCKKCGQDIEGR